MSTKKADLTRGSGMTAGHTRADGRPFRATSPTGWTIRDEFASRIMIGLLASGEEIGADGYVTTAYALAEDMMDARGGWNSSSDGDDSEADLRPYSARLMSLWKETDAKVALNADDAGLIAGASGAMKDLLLSLGMEWSDEKGEYVFP